VSHVAFVVIKRAAADTTESGAAIVAGRWRGARPGRVVMDTSKRASEDAEATGNDVDSLLRSMGRRLVGRISLTEAQQKLRAVMFQLALEECAGNRSAAARVLGVDRRYVARSAR
jgi:ActR/RegA family two-component response regulator